MRTDEKVSESEQNEISRWKIVYCVVVVVELAIVLHELYTLILIIFF